MSFSSMLGDFEKHTASQLASGRLTQAEVAKVTVAFVTQAIISAADKDVRLTQISNDFTLSMMKINQGNLESDKRIEEMNTKIKLMNSNALDNRLIKAIDSYASLIAGIGAGGLSVSKDLFNLLNDMIYQLDGVKRPPTDTSST